MVSKFGQARIGLIYIQPTQSTSFAKAFFVEFLSRIPVQVIEMEALIYSSFNSCFNYKLIGFKTVSSKDNAWVNF